MHYNLLLPKKTKITHTHACVCFLIDISHPFFQEDFITGKPNRSGWFGSYESFFTHNLVCSVYPLFVFVLTSLVGFVEGTKWGNWCMRCSYDILLLGEDLLEFLGDVCELVWTKCSIKHIIIGWESVGNFGWCMWISVKLIYIINYFIKNIIW